MPLKNGSKFEEELTFQYKNWHEKFNEFSHTYSKISNTCPLIACFSPKYLMFELRKYRVVIFDRTEYWYKIWRKTDSCFQKWHEEFGKFSVEH